MDTKKYIIEIPDNTAWLQLVKVSDKDGHVCFDFKDPEDLTLYTEPDLDAIRNEAYEKGVQDTKQHWVDAPRSCAYRLGYESGLNDAWDAARKIVLSREDGGLFEYEARKSVFGCGNYMALKRYSAPEAIEKIRQYEERKEKHTWICSEVNEPSVDTTLICSECGYAIKIKPHETPGLNFCPKCGDCKKPKEEET